jgi:hypothetical protein
MKMRQVEWIMAKDGYNFDNFPNDLYFFWMEKIN